MLETLRLTEYIAPKSTLLEFSLNGAELSLNSVNSENLRKHWSMNWVQYKDLLCYLCLCGLVVSSLSLTQEILGSNPTLLIFYLLKFFCHWIQRIQWKTFRENSIIHFITKTAWVLTISELTVYAHKLTHHTVGFFPWTLRLHHIQRVTNRVQTHYKFEFLHNEPPSIEFSLK